MNALALDIGGANIKAAHSAGGAWSRRYVMHNDSSALLAELRTIAAETPAFDHLLVTTTAELCDCFATKAAGVRCVADAVAQLAADRPGGVWSTRSGFVAFDHAAQHWLDVAAANWHALATFAARLFPVGLTLLIDTGSTTTDIVRLRDGHVDALGLSDVDRLSTGELVYTGAVHTPVMALGATIPHRGRVLGVMAEPFATAADVHVLTGELPADPANYDTADGQPLDEPHCARRLVRCVGADATMMDAAEARELARALAEAQRGRVAQGIGAVLAGASPQRVVISGSGEFLAAAAARAALPDVEQISLTGRIGSAASAAACAHALLHLWEE